MTAVTGKRLLLLRHAKSSWTNLGLADIDRPLNARGRQAASAVGAFLAANRLVPDHAVVSASRRTRETWERACRRMPSSPEAVFSDALYHGGPSAMLWTIRESPAEAECVLLLGHNPGMGAMAYSLAGGNGPMAAEARFLKFPTAGLAIFSVSSRHWASFTVEDASIQQFVDARSLTD